MKITKYRDVIEATTVVHSSLRCLLHPYESIVTKGKKDVLRVSDHLPSFEELGEYAFGLVERSTRTH